MSSITAIGSTQWVQALATEQKYIDVKAKEDSVRSRFLDAFGIDKIRSFSPDDLLDRVFLNGKKDTLCYLLEYDKDYDLFGGIGGNSAYKYGIFLGQNGTWISGRSKASEKEVSTDEAKRIAASIIYKVIEGAELLASKADSFTTIEAYKAFESDYKKIDGLTDVWVLKYYQMLFPEVFPTFYSAPWQKKILSILHIFSSDSVFERMGLIALHVKECGVSNTVFAQMLHDHPQGFDDYLEQILTEYPSEEERNQFSSEKKQQVPKHPYASLLDRASEVLRKKIPNADKLQFKGSAGDWYNFALVPWIGIRNKEITKSFKEGVYIVYLFSHDMTSVYLTLNQGVDDTGSTAQEKRELLVSRKREIQQLISTDYFSTDEIALAATIGRPADYVTGCIFSKKYDADAIPDEDTLLSDLNKMVALYNEYVEVSSMDYNSKNEKRKYWIFRHSGTELDNPFEQFGKQHSFAFSQYEIGIQGAAVRNLNRLALVREGDILFFESYQRIYAYGEVIMPRVSADEVFTYPKNNFNHNDYPNKVIHFDGIPLYNDFKNNPLYGPENAWGQRIDVERWINDGPNEYVSSNYAFDLKSPAAGICIDEISEKKGKQLIKELGGSVIDVYEYSQVLKKVHNIVLTGAPGTGKTYLAMEIARKITKDDDKHIVKVQFHPSFDYTDFVEGLRPVKTDGGNIGFKRKDGIFKKLCKCAQDAIENNQNDENFVMIIDEINRGDISKIFGELFSSIEHDYRGEKGKITTQYSNLISDNEEDEWAYPEFWVPKNVFIIGTMNDIDRSVESMDFAIRRRFTWFELKASENRGMLESLDLNIRKECIERMDRMNKVISKTAGLGPAYEIGGAYFRHVEEFKNSENPFIDLWNYYLKPLISEYLRGYSDRAAFDEIAMAFDPNLKPEEKKQ